MVKERLRVMSRPWLKILREPILHFALIGVGLFALHAWVASSVHVVLFRQRYRGEPEWNKTKKRDRWGQHRVSDRPADQWLHVSAPQQRIVSEELWQAAHAKIATARSSMSLYHGRGSASKYLLPGLARCAWCNGGMYVRIRTRSRGRIPFYACTSHFTCGDSVRRNFHLAPMDEVDDTVLERIGQILTPDLVDEVVPACERSSRLRPRPTRVHRSRPSSRVSTRCSSV